MASTPYLWDVRSLEVSTTSLLAHVRPNEAISLVARDLPLVHYTRLSTDEVFFPVTNEQTLRDLAADSVDGLLAACKRTRAVSRTLSSDVSISLSKKASSSPHHMLAWSAAKGAVSLRDYFCMLRFPSSLGRTTYPEYSLPLSLHHRGTS